MYDEWCCLAALYAYWYYVMDDPQISDTIYDTLFKDIEEMENSNPTWKTKYSPTQNVDKKIVEMHLKKCTKCSLNQYKEAF